MCMYVYVCIVYVYTCICMYVLLLSCSKLDRYGIHISSSIPLRGKHSEATIPCPF